MKKLFSHSAYNIRSAIVLAAALVVTFIVLDSYTWQLLSLPWKISSSSGLPASSHIKEGPENSFAYSNSSELHVRLVSPPEADAAIWKAKKDDGIKDDDYLKYSENEMQAVVPMPSSMDTTNLRPRTFFGVPSPSSGDISIPLSSEVPITGGGGEGSSAAIQSISPSRPPVVVVQSSASHEIFINGAPATTSTMQASDTGKDTQHSYTNLHKLETSLRKARTAIKRAVSGGGNSNVPKNYEPVGELYWSDAFFRQSYYEMEGRFKIFVYPEGEEPLVHVGPCKEIYAIEGRFIQELQGRNRFLTSDPEKAHVFFLPFSVANMVSYLYSEKSMEMSPLTHVVKDYVDVVKRRYPYWNRSGGADHFMLTCHDWGPVVSTAYEGLSRNAIRALCNANLSEGYIPYKDASLPEINLIGGHLPAELGGLSGPERNYLAFFAGGDHGPVRPLLFEFWKEKDNDVRVFQSLPPGQSYQDFMKNSKFCLCPGGYEVNSPRIVEAIYNDCVPVIIADGFVLPFSDILDWSTFSIHLLEKDIPNLKMILESVSMEKYLRMQERVRQVRRHFLFNQPPQRYDVFHMILHSVWLRRLNVFIHD